MGHSCADHGSDDLHKGNHHHHHHNPANEKSALLAAILTGSFMFAELIGGLMSGSLALLADAGHMLTDFAALFMAWIAFRMARKPANSRRTFGFERLQILVAFVNGLTLIAIAIWIFVEAVDRFLNPIAVQSEMMMVIAFLGLVINIVVFKILHQGDTENLNMKGAIVHVIGDLLGSVAALLAGIVIYLTGYYEIDPILSVLVGLILVRSGWYVMRESAHILLENVPSNVDLSAIRADLIAHFDIVEDIHHMHGWAITQDRPIVTFHAKVARRIPPEEISCQIKQRLYDQFNIDHATIEIEYELCADEVLPTLGESVSHIKPCDHGQDDLQTPDGGLSDTAETKAV